VFRRFLRVPGESLELGAGPDGGRVPQTSNARCTLRLLIRVRSLGTPATPAATSAHSSALQGPPDAGHTGWARRHA
jgi:hypothetical protein